MPDRRQHDRRESSTLNSKKLSISLGNFIMIFIIFILIICSIILFRYFYNKGFKAGDVNGYNFGYDDGYSFGYKDGYGTSEEVTIDEPSAEVTVVDSEVE